MLVLDCNDRAVKSDAETVPNELEHEDSFKTSGILELEELVHYSEEENTGERSIK